MSRWQDPRIGTFKSALQKYVRRGEIDEAVAAASALLRIPGGRIAVVRRLPVIGAEDVGARWLPAVVALTRDARSATNLDALDERLRAATAALASLPKSKEPFWLAATCWDGRRIAGTVSPSAIGEALDRGDHQTAVAIYIAARDARQWRSGQRIIDEVLVRARNGPGLAWAIAEAALWREGQGGFGTDELAAAAIIATIDCQRGPLPELPQVGFERRSHRRSLAWYVFDGHTIVGQRVIGRVARRHGMSARMLGDLMFTCESIRLGPTEEDSRWRDEALDLDARMGGWHTHTEGEEMWRLLRDEMRQEIEREAATR